MAVVVYSVNPYLAIQDKLRGPGDILFAFNGVDQYATFPAWTPLGLPFTIKIEGYAVTVGGTASTLMGTTGATWDAVILASSVWNLRYEDALASQQVLVDGTAVVDSPGRLEIYYTADGISFESIDPASVETALYIPGMELTTIAGPNSGLGDFFHGNVAQMAFIDSSPIQDTYANMGDGNRYGELEQAIVLEGDFEIEWEGIRHDTASGAGLVELFGYSDGSTESERRAVLYDSGSSVPDRILVGTGVGSINFNNAFAAIAQGQHYKAVWTKNGSDHTLQVDGVQVGNASSVNVPDFAVGKIYTAYQTAGRFLPTDSAIQNIVIKDLDNNLTWNYPLNEGTGTDIINTDPRTPGYNGSWAPDTAWTFIDSNTRHYPMNEGSGDTFKAYNGKGEPTPVNDATIVNYTDNWS